MLCVRRPEGRGRGERWWVPDGGKERRKGKRKVKGGEERGKKGKGERKKRGKEGKGKGRKRERGVLLLHATRLYPLSVVSF